MKKPTETTFTSSFHSSFFSFQSFFGKPTIGFILLVLLFPLTLNSQTAPSSVNVGYVDVDDATNDYSTVGTGNGAYGAATTYNLSFSSSSTANNNLVIESLTVGGEVLLVTRAAATPKFRRNDNATWTGIIEFLFMEKNSQTGNDVEFKPEFALTMEQALNSKIINRGTDNTFVNNDANNGNNIERLDYVFLNGLTVARAASEGFALFERNGNDNMKIAPILTIDGSGNPTSFGNLVSIGSGAGNWYNTGFSITTTTFRDNDVSGTSTLQPNEDVGAQNVTACYVSMQNLSISDGTTIYGYSLFGNDVTNGGDNANLIDWTNTTRFPITTASGDGGSDLIAGGVHVSLPNSDGSGPIDVDDDDDDNDGIPDVIEVCGVGAVDFSCLTGCTSCDPSDDDDMDGIQNYLDADFCTLNAAGVCTILDKDGDGIIDQFDLDSDNDGIPDLIEAGGTDVDKDGVVDVLTDTDTDGLADIYDSNNGGAAIANLDSDGDGLVNCFDLDADNDGIPDMIEAGGVDTNGDGQIDYPTANDPTSMIDADGDGLADTYDDSDYNGNSEGWSAGTVISNTDSDGDGKTDYIDLDADNDGIPDLVEAGGVDSNGDGLVDGLTGSGTLVSDNDNDGFTDNFDPDDDGTVGVDAGESTDPLVNTDGSANMLNGETAVSIDTDGDGLPDHIDLDADNDGIPDLVEAGGIDTDGNGRTDVLTDADNDGYADIYDTDDDGTAGVEDATDALLQTGGTDTDGDGKADDAAITYTDGNSNNADHDGDGHIDGLDLDADNDGIPDTVESGASDPDNDGKVDTGALPWDADGDGLADIYDESASDGPAGSGTNGTALVETTADTNADGILNSAETMTGGGSNNINYDSDSNPNHLDLDSDNDGITDVVENASGDVTADHSSGTLDGIVGDNASVTDVDNDGWHDPSNSTTTDTDGDGISDYLDIDADNDGIPDYLEGVCSTCPTFIVPTGSDSDGDGVLDIYENLTSANANSGSNTGTTPNEDDDDGSNPPDYLDTDTDNDTAFDWTEGFDFNNNGSANDDIRIMATDYETATSNGYYDNGVDTDGDGLPDYMDNQPSVAGNDENSRPPFLDPLSAFWFDTNNDGLVAIFDANENGTAAPTPDNNGIDDKDWRDMATVVLLPVELLSFSGYLKDCQVTLEWMTGSEERFSHFEIERSNNGFQFEQLSRTEARGGGRTQTYRYQDGNAKDENYYRLKIVDQDGSFKYSEVISIVSDCSNTENQVTAYPNPASLSDSELNLSWEKEMGTLEISIINNVGQIMSIEHVDTSGTSTTLNISRLPTGMYQLILNNGTRLNTLKFMKVE